MSVFSPATPFASYIYRHFRIIHALKLGLALLIAVIINAFWAQPHFVWSMVTIVIIMMSLPQVGGAVEKSMQRAVGTCIGSAYGVMLVVSFQNYWLLMGLLILGVSVTCFISAGRYSYAYLVAGFTMIIVIGDANHDTSEALWRTANILLGCFIAVLVSLFVFPIKAKQDWRSQLAQSTNILAVILDKHFTASMREPFDARPELESAMKAVLTQKKLFFSLEWESKTLKQYKSVLTQLVNKQIRVITLMELLLQTRWTDEDSASYAKVNQIARILQSSLSELGEYLIGQRTDFPVLPERMAINLHQELLASLDRDEQQEFALTGYSWLIYQLAKTIESIYAEVDVISQAYERKRR